MGHVAPHPPRRALALVVAALALALSDQARRDVDAHRRAQVAAERLDASLHAVAAVEHRADEGVPATLLAGDLRIALVRGREAAATLRALRPGGPARARAPSRPWSGTRS